MGGPQPALGLVARQRKGGGADVSEVEDAVERDDGGDPAVERGGAGR
ncbi:hypothetical protein ACIA8I_19945 [Streptomyces rishiriensis]